MVVDCKVVISDDVVKVVIKPKKDYQYISFEPTSKKEELSQKELKYRFGIVLRKVIEALEVDVKYRTDSFDKPISALYKRYGSIMNINYCTDDDFKVKHNSKLTQKLILNHHNIWAFIFHFFTHYSRFYPLEIIKRSNGMLDVSISPEAKKILKEVKVRSQCGSRKYATAEL